MLHLSLGRQFHRLFLGQILLGISIVPGIHAASSSAPLAVIVLVVKSCSVATAQALVTEDATADATSITPEPVVTILCPRGFDPAITIDSGNYASDLAIARTRFVAANTTRTSSSESSADRSTVETHRTSFGGVPVRSLEPRAISWPEAMLDAEKGSYEDSVKVTINF